MKKGKQKQHLLQLVSNEKARRRKFEKRNKSLEKAAMDLSTLCGVDIGMIVFGPDQPTAWNQEALAGLTEAYKARKLCTKPYDLPDFYKEETEKMKANIDRLRFEKLNFKTPEESKQFRDGLMAKIGEVRARIDANSYYYNPPAQGSVWNNDQVQQQTNFVYYNNYDDNNNNNQMMGYYGGGGASNYNGMCTSSNYAAYNMNGGGASSNGMYGTGMMTMYNDEMMGCCNYKMPNEVEQQMLGLEWASSIPDGQKLLNPAVEWFLKEESSW